MSSYVTSSGTTVSYQVSARAIYSVGEKKDTYRILNLKNVY